MRQSTVLAALTALLLAGCAGDEEPPPITGTQEEITTPSIPSGPATAQVNESVTLTTGGASSSLGHPVEYRFDFGPSAETELSEWSESTEATTRWPVAARPGVRAQARCRLHPAVESQWSDPWTVAISIVPATEVLRVRNSYWINDVQVTGDIDFSDAEPDTLPFGSWVTVFYRGVDASFDDVNCLDEVNKCWRYQMRHDWVSTRDTTMTGFTPWLPVPAVDTDAASTVDSMSMNIGSVDYTIFARAVDQYDVPDPTPPQLELVGNFAPTLDGFALRDMNGATVADGDTIVWDWWAPADSGFVISGQTVYWTKTFIFVIEASGHDDPREEAAAGGLSWRYTFEYSDSPGNFYRFGRSQTWVDGITQVALGDTHVFVAKVPPTDMQGDSLFGNLPVWNDESFEFEVKARDVPRNKSFTQYMIYNGEWQLTNQYVTDRAAAETLPRGQRFHIKLVR